MYIFYANSSILSDVVAIIEIFIKEIFLA